ncbi:MAG: VWA domain-containing protein [Pyrinomonadaceae bacterium]|nr:VWA domain-containing protein [Pyrinomonadaceae bacterium]MCX7638918.1 VWA domain-containing protein [Pyrinomonadaceae bacterium]MDW8304945.1 VWA domain-containing protein [Acidobacteriota bacterium]
MIKKLIKKCTAFILLFLISYLSAQEQEKPERITVEEIQINFSAFDSNGSFVPDVRLEDFVILENGRIHQPVSVRYLPANVLILIDVGSEMPYAKRRKISAQIARELVNSLRKEDLIAIMQYAEKISLVSDWTSDKKAIIEKLDERKLDIGKLSNFYLAIIEAVKFLQKAKSNRHLVIITDGVDSSNQKETMRTALRDLLSSDVNVHVISWTSLQKRAIEESLKVSPSIKKPQLPPGAEPPIQGSTPNFPVLTINLDREMIKKRRQDIEKLKKSESFLTEISESTNGELFLPDSEEEMLTKAPQLALNIDSQYTATYIPKSPLSEAQDGEVRIIEVFSKRQGLLVQGKRKLIVSKTP